MEELWSYEESASPEGFQDAQDVEREGVVDRRVWYLDGKPTGVIPPTAHVIPSNEMTRTIGDLF